MILAVDSSLGSAVAVVSADGDVLAQAGTQNALGHAEVIGTLLEQVLAEAGDPEITHVAAGMGPGPFTGLRIGIAAARAFAIARGATLVPVASHDALALEQLDADRDARFVIATDARRRELAWTAYDGIDADGLPRRVTEPALVARADAADVLAAYDVREVGVLHAGFLGRVAARAIAANRTIAGNEPLYMRSPDVAQPKARA